MTVNQAELNLRVPNIATLEYVILWKFWKIIFLLILPLKFINFFL